MDNRDKQVIINRYSERLKKFGANKSALASGNEERRKLRYQVLSEVGVCDGAAVLDLGCGFADFYNYLKDLGLQIKYTGFDINSDLIQVCKEKYVDGVFEVKDIQVDRVDEKFDFIICSQVYNNKLAYDDNEKVIREVIKKLYTLCGDQGGVAIDMLTNYVDFKEDRLHYYSPEEIFKFCKTLTKRVVLRHDYPLYEFTVYLYKDFKGWRK